MPTYEYRCPGCGVIERWHGIGTAPPVEDCYECGLAAMRVLSSPALHRGADSKGAAMAQAQRSRHEPRLARRAVPEQRPNSEVNPAMRPLVGKEKAAELREVPHPASRPGQH